MYADTALLLPKLFLQVVVTGSASVCGCPRRDTRYAYRLLQIVQIPLKASELLGLALQIICRGLQIVVCTWQVPAWVSLSLQLSAFGLHRPALLAWGFQHNLHNLQAVGG